MICGLGCSVSLKGVLTRFFNQMMNNILSICCWKDVYISTSVDPEYLSRFWKVRHLLGSSGEADVFYQQFEFLLVSCWQIVVRICVYKIKSLRVYIPHRHLTVSSHYVSAAVIHFRQSACSFKGFMIMKF